MRLNNGVEIVAFHNAIRRCKGPIWIESLDGDKFNLKSVFSEYLAISNLVSERGDELELFCGNQEDEQYFYELFQKYPDVL